MTCDRCKDVAQFTTVLVFHFADWKSDIRFAGWDIDWTGPQGDARCPACKDED